MAARQRLHPLVGLLKTSFQENADPERASKMESYLRNQFSLFGIQTPIRKKIQAPLFKENPLKSSKELEQVIDGLWELPEREFQYSAIDLWRKNLKFTPSLSFIQQKVLDKAWWDTVDFLASSIVADWILTHPDEISHMREWNSHDDKWVRRTSILFQLKFKDKTDEGMLYEMIRNQKLDSDFFIQKSIGWALREYTKTNPSSVAKFLKENQELSRLAIREASKYLPREQEEEQPKKRKRKEPNDKNQRKKREN